MEPELAQLFIAVYELCLAAELAHMRVDVHLRSGARAVGVPTVLIDDSRLDSPFGGDSKPVLIQIDETQIVLDQIDTCTIFAPVPTRSDRREQPFLLAEPAADIADIDQRGRAA